jgi:uncharacterized protein with von Willebrand factor type A (vWA) domain
VTGLLTAFAAELRAAGLAAGSGEVTAFCAALALLDPGDLADMYWSGRSTLVHRRDDIHVYDDVFRRFFLGAARGGENPLMVPAVTTADGTLVIPDTKRTGQLASDEAQLGWMASDAEVLRRKAFASCTPEELARLRRIMARMRLAPPRRRTRRYTRAPSGSRPDVRRMIRESMRMGGEPGPLRWRRRRVRPRPLILILDISGSMADYSRALLQFAYCTRSAAAHAQVFCFGTRLTRVTDTLTGRNVDAALDRAAATAFDWDAGTRIGTSLEEFVRTWARRGMCRGGIVVICSDGLDRGDPETLAVAVQRLRRLCFRIVWVSPHAGAAFPPLGITAATPHIDALVPGHDLRSMEKLAVTLSALR